jgi:hypothetical protein
MLPLFLFKWNANLELRPDLDDIREYCRDYKAESYLLRSYPDLVHHLYDINIKEDPKALLPAASSAGAPTGDKKVTQKGTKNELINYLAAEVGAEIEFAWRTQFFYVSG